MWKFETIELTLKFTLHFPGLYEGGWAIMRWRINCEEPWKATCRGGEDMALGQQHHCWHWPRLIHFFLWPLHQQFLLLFLLVCSLGIHSFLTSLALSAFSSSSFLPSGIIFTDSRHKVLIDVRQLNYQPVGSTVSVLPLGSRPNLVERRRGRAWMEEKELESGREPAGAKADYTWWYSISSLYPQRHAHGLWILPKLLNDAEDFRPAEKYIAIVTMIKFKRTDSYQNLVHLMLDFQTNQAGLYSQWSNCN